MLGRDGGFSAAKAPSTPNGVVLTLATVLPITFPSIGVHPATLLGK